MNTSKLRAVLKGHKGAVAKLTAKLEEVTDETEVEENENILHSLEKKLQSINDLHEKIIDSIPEDKEDEIEREVIEQDDYIYILQSTINKIKKTIKVKNSNLNIAAPSFTRPLSSTENAEVQPHEISSGMNNRETVPFPNFSANSQSYNSVHSSIYHRLPKLDLPTFNGSILEWQSFWDSYESAIHANPSLTDVQKFNYLKSLLKQDALQTVAGFALTNTNYQKAISLLHERYGQREKIIQTYMKALLDMPAPTYSFAGLRHFYDNTEIYIRGLESLGQTEDTYGSLLVPVILNKLPAEIRKSMTREHGSSTWNLSDIRKCLLKELTIMDAGNDLESPLSFPYTASFVTNAKSSERPTNKKVSYQQPRYVNQKLCAFCKGSHVSTDCKNVNNYEDRMKIAKRDRLCYNCLGKHKISDCKSKSVCRKCSLRHHTHTSLCKGNTDTGSDQKTQNAPKTSVETHSAKDTDTVMLHSANTYAKEEVLLKTAVSTIESEYTTAEANILFWCAKVVHDRKYGQNVARDPYQFIRIWREAEKSSAFRYRHYILTSR
ncbi:uncharacterized protein LOC123546015 [Mercenaria mercenaria]|uniref:uncharacterized protein LOC123546015 n=1 Tax=Mercenaria mercenaria TaxID=6596 RepID=UPI00234EC3AB|nr:uncharacterized protein LOC123546015 [Mercenaria mercenaria]